MKNGSKRSSGRPAALDGLKWTSHPTTEFHSWIQLSAARVWCDRYGLHAVPDACWLALRGLRTLRVRMQRHEASALTVAHWLQRHPAIERVMFPVLPDDPGHDLWKAQFTGRAGPFSFELKPCTETAFERFIDGLQLFSIGTSWGGFESLVMPAIPHHLRGQKVQPDEGRLVRLHVGLEDASDLCDDLGQALSACEWSEPRLDFRANRSHM